MPIALLQRVGRQVSVYLHDLVFSFPSPNVTDPTLSAPYPVPGGAIPGLQEDTHAGSSGHAFMDEPGEPKAFANGVGPLSFVGSGYGFTLLLVVSQTWSRLAGS